MQVILLERVEKLGQMGDVVEVKPGYARNFLLPRKKALRATKQNMEGFEQRRTELEARNLEQRQEAEAVAARAEGLSVVMIRQAGETGQLYGSVSVRDIAQAATEAGFAVDRRQVLLDRPIKALGLHTVRVALHPEVFVEVTVNVARSETEAERQAGSEDATAGEEESAMEETAPLPEDATEPEAREGITEDEAKPAI